MRRQEVLIGLRRRVSSYSAHPTTTIRALQMNHDDAIHFARIESPVDAFRSLCGAWRRARNWTTVPQLVTCPACLAKLDQRRAAEADRDRSHRDR